MILGVTAILPIPVVLMSLLWQFHPKWGEAEAGQPVRGQGLAVVCCWWWHWVWDIGCGAWGSSVVAMETGAASPLESMPKEKAHGSQQLCTISPLLWLQEFCGKRNSAVCWGGWKGVRNTRSRVCETATALWVPLGIWKIDQAKIISFQLEFKRNFAYFQKCIS